MPQNMGTQRIHEQGQGEGEPTEHPPAPKAHQGLCTGSQRTGKLHTMSIVRGKNYRKLDFPLQPGRKMLFGKQMWAREVPQLRPQRSLG